MRLLLVDDDAATRDLVDAAEGTADCEIVAVSTAKGAIEHIHGPHDIDLVIAEQNLAGGDVLAELARIRPFCSVIAVAAEPTVDGAIAALRGGAVDYVPKPLSREALDAAIAAALTKRELALRLRDRQHLGTVGEIVGGVAHDFNNLLVVITNFAELITEMSSGDDASAVAEAAECITQAGKSAAALTRQLLELARHKAPVPEPVDLHEVLQATEKIVRSAMGAHNKLELGPVPLDCRAMADRGHLEHVLLNLAVFARDTMPNGSTLSVTADRGKDTARLVIHASGTRLSDDALAHLFEPYFAARETMCGSGFGLSGARDLVEAVGGSLTAQAGADGGTTFDVVLPAAPDDDELIPA